MKPLIQPSPSVKKKFVLGLAFFLLLILLFFTFQRVGLLGNRKYSAEDIHLELEEGVIPALYQWDDLWGGFRYGDNSMELAGCGPTCLSMVAMGLTGEDTWNPIAVAELSLANGYKTSAGTSWGLMTEGAAKIGLTGKELPLDENRMIRELNAGHPIICSMRPGDFTTTGHFIVLTGYDGEAFQIHDPNSKENTAVTWTYERIKGQIKNLWSYVLQEQ